jgi:pyruvate formate lyase activating enzyme
MASEAGQGLVFDIQHFAIHDGPGIRTTVFLKGCPLHCLWCHNPEGQPHQPQIFYAPEKCIGCRFCEQACELGLHHFEGAQHIYDRINCTSCGRCVEECYSGALDQCGKWMSIEAVLESVLADRDFYVASGGGLTLSGGEPLSQFIFALDLLRAARLAGLHTCVETSGYASTRQFLEIAPHVDLILFDLKETDPELHRRFTGVGPTQILDNLFALDQSGAALLLRCPVIPGLNDRPDHFAALAQLASRLSHLVEIQVMPFHPLGQSKSARLGLAPGLVDIARPGEEQVRDWIAAIQAQSPVPVRKG